MTTEVQKSLETVPPATAKEVGEGCALTGFLLVDALWRKLPPPARVVIVVGCGALVGQAIYRRMRISR